MFLDVYRKSTVEPFSLPTGYASGVYLLVTRYSSPPKPASKAKNILSGRGVLLAANVLVQDGLGGLQGSTSGDGDVRGHAGTLPAGPGRGVRVDRGDAEEDVALAHLEDLGRMGSAGGGFSNDHGPTQPLHDVNELLCRPGGGSAGQDDEALLGAVPLTCRGEEMFDGVKSL